jgi:hypothetical protein
MLFVSPLLVLFTFSSRGSSWPPFRMPFSHPSFFLLSFFLSSRPPAHAQSRRRRRLGGPADHARAAPRAPAAVRRPFARVRRSPPRPRRRDAGAGRRGAAPGDSCARLRDGPRRGRGLAGRHLSRFLHWKVESGRGRVAGRTPQSIDLQKEAIPERRLCTNSLPLCPAIFYTHPAHGAAFSAAAVSAPYTPSAAIGFCGW